MPQRGKQIAHTKSRDIFFVSLCSTSCLPVSSFRFWMPQVTDFICLLAYTGTIKKNSITMTISSLIEYILSLAKPEAKDRIYCPITTSSYRKFTYKLNRRQDQSQNFLQSIKPRQAPICTEQKLSLHHGQAGTGHSQGRQKAGPGPCMQLRLPRRQLPLPPLLARCL